MSAPPNITASIPPTVSQLSYQIRHGINPLPPPSMGLEDSFEYRHMQYIHETYQRTILKGFTIAQLETAGCLGNPNAEPSDLPRVIHPLFELSQWKLGPYENLNYHEPLDYGLLGTWDLRSDQAVRDALLPMLHLATMMMTHMMPWPWFDALYQGDRRIVPATDCPDGFTNPALANTTSFHLRGKSPTAAEGAALNQCIIEFRRTYEIRIASTRAQRTQGGNSALLGFCTINANSLGVRLITIGSDYCFPLLRNDITVSERLVQQFHIANTLCHEIMHAFNKFLRDRGISRGDPKFPVNSAEPFFEDEAVCELGYSWANATYGGSPAPMNFMKLRETLTLGGIIRNWPNFTNWHAQVPRGIPSRYRNHALFQGDGNRLILEEWPIPMLFVESLHKEAFWKIKVIKEGPAALIIPHVTGHVKSVVNENGTRKREKFVLISGERFDKLVTQQPGYTTKYNLGPFATAVSQARLDSMMTAQLKANMIHAELDQGDLVRQDMRHHQLTQFETRDFAQHQAMLNQSKTYVPTDAMPQTMNKWEVLQALRSTRFFIRCQANLELGIHPITGNKDKRRRYLLAARQEVARLVAGYPSDANIQALRSRCLDAWNRNQAEP